MFTRSFVVKGLEKGAQAVFLSGDEGGAFVAGHVWRNEVATGACASREREDPAGPEA